MDKVYGLSDIAKELDIPRHRVGYYIAKWNIRPTTRIGSRNGYDKNILLLLKDKISTLEKLKTFRLPSLVE